MKFINVNKDDLEEFLAFFQPGNYNKAYSCTGPGLIPFSCKFFLKDGSSLNIHLTENSWFGPDFHGSIKSGLIKYLNNKGIAIRTFDELETMNEFP